METTYNYQRLIFLVHWSVSVSTFWFVMLTSDVSVFSFMHIQTFLKPILFSLILSEQIIIYLLVIWLKFKLLTYNLKFNILPPPKIWSKFKLLTCNLKFHNTSILMDSFWYCIFILFLFLLLEKRHKSWTKLHI